MKEEKSNKVRYFIIGISIILNSVGVIANSIAIIMRLCQLAIEGRKSDVDFKKKSRCIGKKNC